MHPPLTPLIPPFPGLKPGAAMQPPRLYRGNGEEAGGLGGQEGGATQGCRRHTKFRFLLTARYGGFPPLRSLTLATPVAQIQTYFLIHSARIRAEFHRRAISPGLPDITRRRRISLRCKPLFPSRAFTRHGAAACPERSLIAREGFRGVWGVVGVGDPQGCRRHTKIPLSAERFKRREQAPALRIFE